MDTVWSDDLEKRFLFRLRRMFPGDSLEELDSIWRVECGPDPDNPAAKVYYLMRNDVEFLMRKKPESMLQHLLNNEVDDNLELVRDGALQRIEFEDGDFVDSEYLGYLPSFDPETLENVKVITKGKSSMTLVNNNIFDKIANVAIRLRFLIQKNQAPWQTDGKW